MTYNWIECKREQMFLMPVNLRDWLEEGHLAWFILDAVAAVDLSEFYLKYRNDGWGRAAYDPQMMVSLILYAYCLGVRSSRQIERACEMDVAFRVIAGNLKPDYSTVCRFRAENEEGLGRLFSVRSGFLSGAATASCVSPPSDSYQADYSNRTGTRLKSRMRCDDVITYHSNARRIWREKLHNLNFCYLVAPVKNSSTMLG